MKRKSSDPCIVRVFPQSHRGQRLENHSTDIVLFFPHDQARRDHIRCWDVLHQHRELPLDAFRRSKAPDAEDQRAVDSAISEYDRKNPDFPFTRVQRLPKGWEAKAWRE